MATTIGQRGTVVIPVELRRRYGFEVGTPVIFEAGERGVTIRPAALVPVEAYSPERKAGFLLENAVDAEDYQRALEAVRGMGLDPASIPHEKP
jgi:bifunctional DNA-binding transcriptional regulator/antitoxin component of YhaV-PrlF toxin-antitoxin module